MLDFIRKSNHIRGAAHLQTGFASCLRHGTPAALLRGFFTSKIGLLWGGLEGHESGPDHVSVRLVLGKANLLVHPARNGFASIVSGLSRSQSYDSTHTVGICPKIKSNFQSYCGFSSPRNNGNPISGERFTYGFRSKTHLIGGVA